jgi:hypothetical protein
MGADSESIDPSHSISKECAMSIVKQAVDEACFQAHRFSTGPDFVANIPFGYTSAQVPAHAAPESDSPSQPEPAKPSIYHWDKIENPAQASDLFAAPFNTMASTSALPVAGLQEYLYGSHNKVRNRPLFVLFCHFLSIALCHADRRRLRFSLIINMYGNKSHPQPFVYPGHIKTTIAPNSDEGQPDVPWHQSVEQWVQWMTAADTGALFSLLPHLAHVMKHTSRLARLTVNPGVTSVSYDVDGKLLLESASLPGDIGDRQTFSGHAFSTTPASNSRTILDPNPDFFGELSPGVEPKRLQMYRPMRVATGVVKVSNRFCFRCNSSCKKQQQQTAAKIE